MVNITMDQRIYIQCIREIILLCNKNYFVSYRFVKKQQMLWKPHCVQDITNVRLYVK